MTAILVPAPTSGEVTASQTTTLDGVPYLLSWQYSQRSDTWSLSLAAADGTPIASGMKLVCAWDLLGKCASSLRPPGMLFVFSNTKDLSPPGLADFEAGGRCFVMYVPEADILAAEGA